MRTVVSLVGVACVMAGTLWGLWWVRALLSWPRAWGTVLGLEDGVEIGDKHPKITFTAHDGQVVQFTSRFGIQFVRWWRPGRKVRVLFHPHSPQRAEILSVSNILAPFIVIGFGILLILTGWGDDGLF